MRQKYRILIKGSIPENLAEKIAGIHASSILKSTIGNTSAPFPALKLKTIASTTSTNDGNEVLKEVPGISEGTVLI